MSTGVAIVLVEGQGQGQGRPQGRGGRGAGRRRAPEGTLADERAQAADHEQGLADEHHQRAQHLDPDRGRDKEAERGSERTRR